MKRGQWVALAGGTALGLVGVATGVVLARREGREAARRWLEEYGAPMADQAKQLGSQIASAAAEQYQAQMPKAVEAWNTYAPQAREAINNLVAQAPQAVNALTSALPGGNSKAEATGNAH
jgi:gas vesicle protein